jgi:hypothetical protein
MWYELGAKTGDREAQRHFGFVLAHGLGWEVDLAQSVAWYQRAADQGDAEGGRGLASSLQFGVGCDVDLDDAAKVYAATYQKSPDRRPADSYRCLRALGKAEFRRSPSIPHSHSRSVTVDLSAKLPPLVTPSLVSDYLEPSRITQTGHLIGHGGYSTVYSVKDEVTGEPIAVKRFLPTAFDQATFLREIEILVHLNHPSVLRIHGWRPPIKHDPAEIRTAIAENGSLKHILEKVGSGTQFAFWNATGKAILILGIALGMRFIHSKGIIHRDLKPSNVLVNRRGEPLIGDFGLSCFDCPDYTLPTEGATVNYAAPELFKENTACTRQVDIYAFGLLMYEIITGAAVFPTSEYALPILRRIQNGEMPAIPSKCGSLMQDLIPQCWSTDPEKRPAFDEIVRTFKTTKFCIVPRADSVKLGMYVEDIEDWEAKARLASQ